MDKVELRVHIVRPLRVSLIQNAYDTQTRIHRPHEINHFPHIFNGPQIQRSRLKRNEEYI